MEAVFQPACHGVLGDRDFVECFHRALGLTDRGAECCEVMLADQPGRALAHGVKVEPVFDVPHKAFVMHGGGAADQKAEEIEPFQGREAGVPVVFHPGAGDNGDRAGAEVIVQRFGEAERCPVLLHIGMGDLAEGVNAGIGASGGGDAMGARLQFREGGFDLALHGVLVVLALPA